MSQCPCRKTDATITPLRADSGTAVGSREAAAVTLGAAVSTGTGVFCGGEALSHAANKLTTATSSSRMRDTRTPEVYERAGISQKSVARAFADVVQSAH